MVSSLVNTMNRTQYVVLYWLLWATRLNVTTQRSRAAQMNVQKKLCLPIVMARKKKLQVKWIYKIGWKKRKTKPNHIFLMSSFLVILIIFLHRMDLGLFDMSIVSHSFFFITVLPPVLYQTITNARKIKNFIQIQNCFRCGAHRNSYI